MKFISKYLFSFSVFLLCFSVSHAQLTTTNAAPYNTPQYLVQNVLLGSGITVSNITYNGNPAQIGFFGGGLTNTGASVNIGLDSGIVLNSGNIINCPGPNSIGSATGTGLGLSSDPDLGNIVGSTNTAQDAAILEFDFVPICDSISFDYVFGSEEYPEYVNSFNDAFGFFLSGPGISGPYSNNAVNIALIPGTTTPVTINNVNNGNYSCPGSGGGPCTNCAYYIDNCTPGTNVQYDGFTTVLTAASFVQPGFTYHIKLAVCDANDQAFDSGVFLKAGSFRSRGVLDSVTVAKTDIDCNGNCNGTATVNPYGGLPPYTYQWSNGDTDSVANGLCPGQYIVYVLSSVSTCQTATVFNITQPPALSLSLSATADSGNAEGTVSVSAFGGVSPYTYLWNDANAQTSATATGLPAGTYFVIVTDSNGCNAADSIVVISAVGINENNYLSNVQIYPNPSNEKIFLKNLPSSNLNISVLNSIGQEILNKKIVAPANTYSLQTNNFPEGIYFLKIYSENGKTQYLKFVKNK